VSLRQQHPIRQNGPWGIPHVNPKDDLRRKK
jgi:hypothetical protein